MPLLVLLRHAQAEPGLDDHARPLSARGRADAAAVRTWLAAQGVVPDRAVVSTARRTQETWQLAGDLVPVLDGRLYDASTETIRDVIAETPASVQALVVVGHNPGTERLPWELDDSPSAREHSDRGMPTCGIAVFDVSAWDLAHAALRSWGAPRG